MHGLLPDTLGPLLPPTLKRLSLANRPPDDAPDTRRNTSATVQVCDVLRASRASCPCTRTLTVLDHYTWESHKLA